MENKPSMSRVERLHREKVTRYSIRKYSFGAASVAVAALFMFLGNGAVSADMTAVQPQDGSELKVQSNDENTVPDKIQGNTTKQVDNTVVAEATAKPEESATPALDKKQLENYILEVKSKLSAGKYANKTEDSLALLNGELASAESTLASATTQDELTKAYQKLVMFVSSGLKNKPKEAPKVDTTNGKETVGKKADNTEKKSDTNSIENTGSNDPRNGKALDKNNAFRAETTETQGNFNYSMEYSNGKEIYLYNEEDADVNITVSSTAGNITKATVKAGSGQFVLKSKSDQAIAYTKWGRGSMPPEEEVEIDGYGWSYHQTLSETQGPVKIKITGKPNDTFKGIKAYTKTEDQRAVLGARYLQLEDSTGARLAGGNSTSAPGYFNLVVKSQTYKYSIQQPENNANKIAVSDINNLTETDIQKIKDQINIQYSDKATTEDARLASKKGEVLANKSTVVATDGITVENGTVTVTYKDGSVDTTPVASVARTNEKPTVEIPYSLDGKKDVYVYANEDFEIPVKFTDDSGKVASATIKRGGNQNSPAKDESNPDVLDNEYNTTIEKISTETVATPENPAIVKIKGNISKDNSGIAESKFPKEADQELTIVTRYATATDTDGAFIENTATSNSYATDPGSFTIKLKAQTAKYDITKPAEADKVAVADANSVTDAEFEKIKAKVKIEYSNDNKDKNLADKKGTEVENQNDRIASITKDGNNVIVTYKDGSKDTKPLTDFARTNEAPTVELPYSNPDKKQIYVYTGENTDLTFTGKDDTTVKNLYLRNKGLDESDNASGYGFTIGKVTDSAVASGEGTVSDDKKIATIKMVGVTNLSAGQKWTSFIEAKDNDGVKSMPANEAYNVENNYELRRRKLGYVEFIVKSQMDKYDIKTPTEKVAVTDPANVTEAELDKIKEKLQIEYSNNNDDANLADKKGKTVDAADAKTKIKSVTKDADGNLVVTYTDGSVDKKSLADFTTLNKQPAIDAVKQAAKEKIDAINSTPNATDEEKAAAIAKVNADKDNALAEIVKPEVTTKDALDKAQKAGTSAIEADNPVVAKKDEAKKAIDTALEDKNKEIDARTDLTPEEKTKAKEVAKAQADAAKGAVDKATTDAEVDTAKNAGTGEVANVTPVVKEVAKKAVADELKSKEEAIDARDDLTLAEKTKAKEEAQAKAKEATDAINKQPDAATTPEKAAEAQTAVDAAKKTGVDGVKAVNPVAKEVAKQSIADALNGKDGQKGKLQEIEERTDLTDEEKAAAKKEAQDKANAELAKIDEQPNNVDDPKALPAVQKAVDDAGNKGVADVTAVNPTAVKKPEAIKAIEKALTDKEAAIDKLTDLTPEAKQKAKELAKAAADKAKKAITDATTDTAVDVATEAGKGAIEAVTPVVKEPAKQAIKKALEDKNAEIDKRTDLTDEEKTAAKKDAKDKADAQLAEIAKQPDVAATPEAAKTAQDAVDAAKKTGVDEVTAVNPTAVTKPAAKKAIEDKLAKQLETIANTPDATDEEKAEAVKKATAAAETAKKAVDEATTDAAVKAEKDKAVGEGDTKGTIDQAIPVVEDKPNARKAIEEEAKAKKEAIDARNDLTPKAKEALKAKVDKVAEKAKEAIDAVTSVEDVNTIEESDKAAIKSIGDINRPIDKVLVKDSSALTDEEKAKILEEVKKVNPTAREVKYNDEGNIEVTTENGDKGTIKPAKLVKTEGDLDNGKGGNDIHKPIDKVIVKDPANLTDEEKAKIVAKVEEVNPDAIVTIDENGTVSVSTPDGKTAAIPATDLVRTKEDTAKAGTGNSNIVKPADKVVGEANDLDDQAKVEAKLRELNPETKSVIFDENGNATVTLKDGTTATIPSEDLFRSEADATTPNAGNDIVNPADKTVVANPDKLTDAEKKAIEDKVKAVNPDATVVVDDKGNATVTTPEGKTATIPAADLTKSASDATKPKAGNDIVKPADKTVVANPDKLTDAEKKAIEDKVKAVNPGSTVVVDDKGNATVTTPEGKTAVIPASDLTKSEADAAKPNAGNDIVKPADKTVAANPEKLTDAEKKAIADKVKAVNSGSTVAVDDKGNATVTTPEGKTAVIPATDLVKSPEDATKPNAGNDIVKPADKTVVGNPDALTPEEKKSIAAKVAAVNPGSTVVVDDKGNATVTTPEGKTAVIPATDWTKSASDAAKPNAGNDIVKPADKTVVGNPDALTPEEKKSIAAKVAAVNPGSTVVVDDKGNATVTTPEGKTAVIPATDLTKSASDAAKPNAGNDIVKPADKTVVANPDALTPEEKKAIAAKVAAVNPGSTVVVDDKGNATVTTPEGKTAVIPATDLTKSASDAAKPNAGNDIVKPADKTVVANPDALTPEEKKAIAAKVKAVNPGSTVVVDDKGNATVTTPEGKIAVIPATDLTKSASDAAKPNAGNDIVKPADKTVVANPDALTPEEKKAIAAKVAAVNPDSTVAVDDKGNATVTTPEGKTAVIPAADLTKSSDAEKAPKAGNDIVKPASKTKVANPDALTPEEKDAIAAKVAAVNLGATVVVDDKGNATVTLPNGKTAVIPASDLTKSEKDVNDGKATDNAVTLAAKTKVANPNALTDAEKKAIEDKVKAANPGAEVVVDDKGNATVVKDGNVSVIPSTDLVKVEGDATKPNGGNDANTPAAKTVVEAPAKLTDAEKEAVKKAVEAVNPGSTVVVDDKGNATVTKADGTVLNIPASDLVIPAEKFADEAKTAKVKTPAIRTLVGNKDSLTKDEKDAVKKSIEAVNPGATVVVDDQGNATVTMPDGSTATISKEQLVKNAEDAKAKNGGNNLDFDLSKVTVADLENITPEEKAKFQFKVLGAITNVEEFDLDAYIKSTDENGNTVYTSKDSKVKITIDKDGNATVEKDGKKELAVNIDKAGNVTIVTKEGQVLAIPRDDAFKQRPYVPSNGGGNNSGNGNGTSDNNAATNTDAKVDKSKLEGAIHQLDELIIKESAKLDAETAKEANDLLADAKKVFANADASQAEVDAMVKRIEDFMAKVAPTTPANDQTAQTPAVAPATTQAANANQAAANARTVAKELPNTGTADSTVAMVAAAASAVLGLGLAGRRRKEDEEA